MTLISILLILSFGHFGSNPTVNQSNSGIETLTTGWYYMTTKEFGIERKLKGTEELFFISAKPIVTSKNFTEMKIYKSVEGDFGLLIKLDSEGTKNWSIATEKSIGKKLALIIDNELVFTPTVNLQIENGMSALNPKGYSKEELNKIKLNLEIEKTK
jgi:preprotein translocase subunit SecD